MPAPTSRTTAKKAPAKKAAAAKIAASTAAERLIAGTQGSATAAPVPSALDRVIAEALDEKRPTIATWEWAGETWHIVAKPDIRAIAMAQMGSYAKALEQVLGLAEMLRLINLDTDEEFGAVEMWDLLNSMAAPTGATAGE